MSISRNGISLLLLLVACTEQLCKGNETNNGEPMKVVNREHDVGTVSLWSRFASLIDPARLVIFILSLFLITHASQKAVKLDRENRDDINKEGIHELTCYHALCFPVAGSVMLLVFFYLFEFIQYIYTILTAIISAVALFNLVLPAIQWFEIFLRDRQFLSSRKLFHSVLITILLSIAITTAWVLTGHWICLDLLGAAICVFMIQFIRVPSLKIATLLLMGLLIYDVFWVFYSSSIFNANVMVAVATKKAENPVAAVAHRLNLPKAVQSSPPLSIPGKIMVPSFTDGKAFAMLGLGDIVLPGLLLCFAMRVDNDSSVSLSLGGGGGGVSKSLSIAGRGLLLCCRQWSYFTVALIGYAIGLIAASCIADWYRVAQPALLYLVPAVLIPMIIKAFLQGDLSSVWHGPFRNVVNSSPLPTRTTEKHSYHQVGRYSLLSV